MLPDLSQSSLMPRSPSRSTWRIALLWQGTVLDVVTLQQRRGTLRLRTGEMLKVRIVDNLVELTGDDGRTIRAEAGTLVDLPAGHGVVATRALAEPRAGGLHAMDSTLFHAAMIGAAVQACVVSALVLSPTTTLDREAGAGLKTEWRRMLLAPGGTAPQTGRASLNAVGRRPEEAERDQVVRSAGRRPARRAGKGMTAEQALDEMSRVLHLGNDGVELKETLGELAQTKAAAPVLGAGLGGLVPRDPTTAGPGNGQIGAGESRFRDLLRQQRDKAPVVADIRVERPIIPVQVVDVPQARVTLEPGEDLDPVVKDQLIHAVRQRHNAVRHCYESWGLAADVRSSGRLVLEMTLQPDGRVTDPRVKVEGDGLRLVGECVERMASEWYLGDGLVDVPQRLSFPFLLRPQKDSGAPDFGRP